MIFSSQLRQFQNAHTWWKACFGALGWIQDSLFAIMTSGVWPKLSCLSDGKLTIVDALWNQFSSSSSVVFAPAVAFWQRDSAVPVKLDVRPSVECVGRSVDRQSYTEELKSNRQKGFESAILHQSSTVIQPFLSGLVLTNSPWTYAATNTSCCLSMGAAIIVWCQTTASSWGPGRWILAD